jgi:hypothetical protein
MFKLNSKKKRNVVFLLPEGVIVGPSVGCTDGVPLGDILGLELGETVG